MLKVQPVPRGRRVLLVRRDSPELMGRKVHRVQLVHRALLVRKVLRVRRVSPVPKV